MDELIVRSLQEATDGHEERRLALWRATSLKREREFQDVKRIWELAAVLRRPTDEPAPTTQELVQRAQESTMPTRSRSVWIGSSSLRSAIKAAAVLILAFAASWIMLPQREGSSLGAAEFVTGPSEMVTVKLSDGTVVRLAPESRLRLTTNAREVWLEGQAFFGVAAHAGKPFRVRTHAGTAEVLGTRFDARSREGSLRVVVVEGKVKLSAGDESLELIANEMGRISSGTPLEGQAVDEEALLNELDWLGKFIVFKATPLGDAARELSRHYGVPVAVLDSTLAQETIEGWFADRDLSEVIEILCRAVDAHCSILPSGVTIQP